MKCSFNDSKDDGATTTGHVIKLSLIGLFGLKVHPVMAPTRHCSIIQHTEKNNKNRE